MAESTTSVSGNTGNPPGRDSFILSSTFGALSGHFQKARATLSPSTVGSGSSSMDDEQSQDSEIRSQSEHPQDSAEIDRKEVSREEDNPSETESITTETSYGHEGLTTSAVNKDEHDSDSDEDDNNSNQEDETMLLMETKVQFLYGQLQDRERTIQQLQDDHRRTRNEFEVLEKESAECMEELTSDIQDLQDQLDEKEGAIRKLESLQVIPEHYGEDEERMEALKQQLLDRDKRIQELEDNGNSINGNSNNEELTAELEIIRTKLQEKGEMLQKVEEAELLNFSLIEERDEEIVRLNEQIEKLNQAVVTAKAGDSCNSSNHDASEQEKILEDLQAKNDAYRKALEATTWELEEALEKEDEIIMLKKQILIDNKHQENSGEDKSIQISKELEVLSNDLEESNAECKQLKSEIVELQGNLNEQANQIERLNEKLLESQQETSSVLDESKDQLEDSIAQIKELQRKEQKSREMSETLQRCLAVGKLESQELQARVKILEEELSRVQQENSDTCSEASLKVKELTELLQVEEEHCNQLAEKVQKLTMEASKRNQKLFQLGFNSDDEVLEALHNAQKELQQKQVKLEQLSLQQNSNANRSVISDASTIDNDPASSGEESDNDPKSIENLLLKQQELRAELHDRIKSLATAMKVWDSGGEDTKDPLANTKDFYSHLSSQIRGIVLDLKTRDGVQDDLIKAFQLKIQPLASMEKTLKAREIQIEMLVQELEELEEHNNLGTSVNSCTSTNSQSLALNTKLKVLLDDIHERDEKLRTLEWLTLDLSKALESKTCQYEELEEDSKLEKTKLEKRIDLLLNDIKHREVEIRGLKQVVEADEEAANKCADIEEKHRLETVHKIELQTAVNDLTTRLRDTEAKLANSDAQAATKDREKLEEQVDVLSAALSDREREMESLVLEIEGKRELESKISVLQGELEEKFLEVENLSSTLAAEQKTTGILELEKDSKIAECKDLEHEITSIMVELTEREERIVKLEANQASTSDAMTQLEQKVRDGDIVNIQLQEATKEIVELNGQLRELSETNSELLNKVHLLDSKIVELETQVEDINNQLQGAEEEKGLLADQLRELEKNNSGLLGDLEELEDKRSQIAELKGIIEGSSDQLRETTEKLEGAEKEKTLLGEELEEKSSEIAELGEIIVGYSDQLQEMTEKLEGAEQQKTLLCEELQDVKAILETQKNDLSAKLKTEKAQLKQAEEQNRKYALRFLELEDNYLQSQENQLGEASALKSQLLELEKQNADLLVDFEAREKELIAAKDGATREVTATRQLVEDQKSCHQGLIDKIDMLTTALNEKESDLKTSRALCEKKVATINELQLSVDDKAELETKYESKRQECTKLEEEVNALILAIEKVKHAERDGVEKIRVLEERANDLGCQLQNLTQQKASLESQLQASNNNAGLETQLEEQQQRFSQISSNMESIAKVLEEREVEMEAVEKENKLKNEFIQELQEKIDDQSKNMESLMEEYESECAELQEKLESVTEDLKESTLRSLELEETQLNTTRDSDKTSKNTLAELQKENKMLKSENGKVKRRLDAIGFESMDGLIRGLAAKCQEQIEMDKLIKQQEKQIQALKQESGGPKETENMENFSDNQGNMVYVHKLRELEMKIGIFRDEIAGKNAIIEDLTLRLNDDTSNLSDASDDALRTKKVTFETPNNTCRAETTKIASVQRGVKDAYDTAAAKSDKATMPALLEVLKQRDVTIELQEKELASNKRAIDALVKGLEFNVQEKIESDRLVHESKTQCSQFASRVRHLSKELAQRKKLLESMERKHHSGGRNMTRNLASMEDIKALSVNELVDLLTQSRVLAEDLEQERERLIGNATNMSIALAESRSKVDELMDHLGPITADLRSFEKQTKKRGERMNPQIPPRAAAVATEMPSRVVVTGIHHPAKSSNEKKKKSKLRSRFV